MSFDKKASEEFLKRMEQEDKMFHCDTCNRDCRVISEKGRSTGNRLCYCPKGCILIYDEEEPC